MEMKVMHAIHTLGFVIGARGAEPRAFGDIGKNWTEAEEVVTTVAFVAENKLGRGVATAAYLAGNVVVKGGGSFGSVGSFSTK